MLKHMFVAATMIAATMVTTGVANAQSDLLLRNDLRTGLTLPDIEASGGSRSVSILGAPSAEAASNRPSLKFYFELSETFTNNAGFSPDDGEEAVGFAPLIQATYKHPNLFGAWTFQSRASVTAGYYGSDSEFDEGVANIDFQLAHDLHGGRISLFQRSTAFFDGDFDDQGGSTRDYGVGYLHAIGTAVTDDGSPRTTLQTLVFYQDASRDRDRIVVRGDLGHRFTGRALGANWDLGQRLQYSNYQASGRDDTLLSRTTLSASWDVAGAEVSIAAAYTHNFTDDDDVDAFEIGPVIGWRF